MQAIPGKLDVTNPPKDWVVDEKKEMLTAKTEGALSELKNLRVVVEQDKKLTLSVDKEVTF